MNFNESQRKAITSQEKNILVIAGSGSGKTTCLTERINYLLSQGVKPKNILAITFTNLAAEEMRSRIKCDSSDLFVGTIHSFANKLLIANGVKTRKYIDSNRFDKLIEKAIPYATQVEKEHMLVDEFQDLCQHEFNFINSLNIDNTFYIGDPNQSIYGFKGANVNLFLDLLRDETYTVYQLRENYRTATPIVRFAEEKLGDILEFYPRTIPMAGEFGVATYLSFADIPSLVKKYDSFGNWFILTRTNNEIDDVSRMLQENKIPFVTFKTKDLDQEGLSRIVNSDAVKVITIHTSKGMEKENVIVIGAKNYNAEEKRIAYVAATRAKYKLYWCTSTNTKKKSYGYKPKPKKSDFYSW